MYLALIPQFIVPGRGHLLAAGLRPRRHPDRRQRRRQRDDRGVRVGHRGVPRPPACLAALAALVTGTLPAAIAIRLAISG